VVQNPLYIRLRLFLLAGLVLFAALPAPAQRDLNSELNDKISLAPEKVVDILRAEPGLLLECKKQLVNLAYEQGRILDQEDLTDTALFRLIYEDAKIRALVTRQITARKYVTPLPSESEQRRQQSIKTNNGIQGLPTNNPKAAQALAQSTQSKSLEEQARSKQQGFESAFDYLNEDQNGGQAATPAKPVRPPTKSTQRNQKFADLELPGIRPEDLPGLLAGVDTSDPATAGALGALTQTSGAGGLSGADISAALPLLTGNRADETPSEMEALSTPYRGKDVRRAEGTIATEPSQSPEIRRKKNPYSNVPSLYDLYSQVGRSPMLERFGADVFANGTGNVDELPMDVPVGPDYVIGPGDGLKIELNGGVTQRLQRVVDRQGRLALPEVGSVMVAGYTLDHVQQVIQNELRAEFRDIRADVSIARLRSVRVYVVGEVKNPGPYDISALSTALNAVFVAGGPTPQGSIRTLKHMRGNRLVQEMDVYSLLLSGVRDRVEPLQAGDTIVVPVAGPQVTIEGMVRRPAIYELRNEKDLSDALSLAGGILPSATLRHVQVDRLDAHVRRSMLSFDLPDTATAQTEISALQQFKVQDGDIVRIAAILPVSEKSVYLDGHVFRPGKYAFKPGMHVAELVKEYGQLLPEPYKKHAEVIRLTGPDYRPEVVAFDLGKALEGNADSNIELEPFDTVRVFGRFDFEDPPTVTVTGEVRDPGQHRTSGEIRLADAVYLAGGLTPDALADDAQVFRGSQRDPQVLSVNLGKAMAGDSLANIVLLPQDHLIIHKNLARTDPPFVFVGGEVGKPGKYPLGTGLTASQLVKLAGGFTRGAYTERADLSRYSLVQGERVEGAHQEVEIAKAFNDPNSDVLLHDGDTLSIRQISGFKNLGATVSLKGEVLYPSTYGISEGEKLSAVLARAGGFSSEAFPEGIIVERQQLREVEEKQREELVARLDAEQQNFQIIPNVKTQEELAYRQSFLAQQALILTRLRSNPAVGRMVVRINRDVNKWQNTPSDVELRAGDVITIPKRPTYVMVSGQVYHPNAVSFRPGKSARWYLNQAGGPTSLGNPHNIFVVKADGSVIGGKSSGWWVGDALDRALGPGDTVVVPERVFTNSNVLRELAETAQIISSVALSVSVALR
jgi:polysaccharide export outer membrane protein